MDSRAERSRYHKENLQVAFGRHTAANKRASGDEYKIKTATGIAASYTSDGYDTYYTLKALVKTINC